MLQASALRRIASLLLRRITAQKKVHLPFFRALMASDKSNVGKEDTFCKSGLLKSCVLLRSKCIGFEIDRCSDDIECCQCSFVDCPLSNVACNKIAQECFYADFVTLQLEDHEIQILRKLFEKFDEDADAMLNFSETMSLIEKAETNTTRPAIRLADRPSKEKSLPAGKIIINERIIEKTTVRNLGQEDFEKLCVTVSENPSKGVSLGTFFKIFAKHHGWFYQHIQRLVHHEQYQIMRRDGCSTTAKAKEAIDNKLAIAMQEDGILVPDAAHSKLAEDPCDAESVLKEEDQANEDHVVAGSQPMTKMAKIPVENSIATETIETQPITLDVFKALTKMIGGVWGQLMEL
mmetsp:Transcript_21778/g.30515  ORF Transcript_21778/g.30515 Transcript_21778/m.30515 type:complete len:348 (-) Transcript_21778:226-1269(-)